MIIYEETGIYSCNFLGREESTPSLFAVK